MTDKLRAAAKDLISAWDSLTTDELERAEDYVEALRQALEESPNSTTDFVELEAVAWLWKNKDGSQVITDDPDYADGTWTPLYTAPPKREWQGLTDEEIDYIWGITKPDYENKFDFPRAIEAKLKEKNHVK